MNKNMRKGLGLIFSGLSTLPFAFSKMEPCFQVFKTKIVNNTIKIEPLRPLKNSNDIPENISQPSVYEATYLFLYDRNTGYSIGSYIPKHYGNLKTCADFFKCKENVNLSDLRFFGLQENLGLMAADILIDEFGYNDSNNNLKKINGTVNKVV